jgi:hypothetical protein
MYFVLMALAGCGFGSSSDAPQKTPEMALKDTEAAQRNTPGPDVLRPDDWFEDVTTGSGIDAVIELGVKPSG